MLGLGCENNNIPLFKTVLGDIDEERVRFMSTQEHDDEVGDGFALSRSLWIMQKSKNASNVKLLSLL